MEPHFFETPEAFRNWLDKNHDKESELLVGFYKTGTGKASMTWPQSVDQALCFGWIDGVRKSLGDESYTIRFTPRKPNSIWSTVNINKMEGLKNKGLVKPEGLVAYEKRKESRSGIYSHEQEHAATLPAGFEKEFREHAAAWDFFMKQAPSYRKAVIHLITTAKQEKTKRSRFEKLLEASKSEKRIL